MPAQPEQHRRVMTKLRLYAILAAILLATVPWFFTRSVTAHILGFPPWAFYSICMTIVYAIVVAFFVGRYWPLSEDDNDEL